MEKHDIPNENIILIDWITFTSFDYSVADLKHYFGLAGQPWDLCEYGRYGYKRREVFQGVSILYDGRVDETTGIDTMGICVECSGQGCRALETYGNIDWLHMLAVLTDENESFRITRLDLAFDDHTGILDKLQLKLDTDDGNYRSLFRNWEIRYGAVGFSIYHGSRKSDVMIRIYDKAAERGLFDGSHWIRVEAQLRDANAQGAARAIVEHQDVGSTFSGILAKYLVYLTESDDSNRSRWPVADYWQELIHNAARITIAAKPGVDYNIFHMEHFLINTAGGALKTWIEIFGLDALPELLKKRTSKLNPRHQMVLQAYQQHKLKPHNEGD